MDSIRQYLLSVISAAIFSSIAVAIVPKKGMQASIIKITAGLIMTITVISPLTKFDFTNLQDIALDFSCDAQNAAKVGEVFAETQIREIITQQIEAYIQEKAVDLGAEIRVEVELTHEDPPVPLAVTIYGTVSPYTKSVLERYIENNLAIPEEHQVWR